MIEKTISETFLFVRNGKSIKQSADAKGIPITRIETIHSQKIDVERLGYADIYDEDLDDFKDYLLEKGDVLMSHINSPAHLGKTALYNGFPEVLIHGMNLLCLRTNKDICYHKYAYYYFQTLTFKDQIFKISNQSVNQASFSARNLNKIKIPLPPIETQKRIAEILDNAAALRDKTAQLLEEYDALAQSLFLEMFGDPVTNPKGWDIFKWKDCLEIKNGKNQKKVLDEYGKYPIYGSGGFMAYANDYISEKNTVILGRKGNINKPILVKEKYWNVDTAFGLHPFSDILHYDFLFKFCEIYNFEKHNTTTTIPSLTKNILYNINIPVPPIELQNEFAEKVALIEKQKELAKKELQESEDLFNALLQKAFKGELV